MATKYVDNLLALCFLLEEELVSKMYYTNSIRISYHCWTESLVDLHEGQLMLRYYYVSNINKHVNKKNEERMII